MPEHELSIEALWLTENYGRLCDEMASDGPHWIAVLETEVVDHDQDPEVLATRTEDAEVLVACLIPYWRA